MIRKVAVLVFVLAASSLYFGIAAAGGPSLDIAGKKSFKPGETISVKFEALPTYAQNAWIGIIPANVPHGSEATNDQNDITYKYLNGMTAGTMTFTAPSAPGKYTFRMNDADNEGKEVTFIEFTVAVGGSSAKAEYNVGDTVKILWKGSWYPGKILSVNSDNSTYKITYDGYDSSWDEWVGTDRLRK